MASGVKSSSHHYMVGKHTTTFTNTLGDAVPNPKEGEGKGEGAKVRGLRRREGGYQGEGRSLRRRVSR